MKKLTRALLLAVLAPLALPAFGQEAGREGMVFLCLRGDARSSALGCAETALTEGESALFGNPAGAAQRRQIAISDTLLFFPAGFFGETLAGVWPAGQHGILGASLFLLRHDALPVTTEVQPDGTGSYAAFFDVELSVMAGQWLTEVWGVGMAMRVMHEQMGDLQTKAAAVDLGVIRIVSPELTVGLGARSLGRVIRSENLADSLPFSLDAGLRYSPPELPARLYVGGQMRPFGLSSGGFGVEIGEYYGCLARAAVEWREDGWVGYAGGVGFHLDMWHMDYTVAPVGGLGYMNRLSLSVRFGEGK